MGQLFTGLQKNGTLHHRKHAERHDHMCWRSCNFLTSNIPHSKEISTTMYTQSELICGFLFSGATNGMVVLFGVGSSKTRLKMKKWYSHKKNGKQGIEML